MKIVIYSAVFGGYDPEPYDVRPLTRDNVKFRFYTDSITPNGPGVPATFNGWEILNTVEEPFEGKDKFAKMNRAFKLNPQVAAADSDINVYIDGNKQLHDIDMLLRYCKEVHDSSTIDAIFTKHEHRNTVAEEVHEICKLRRDDPAKVMAQYKGYKEECFPDNIPLIVASVQIRKTKAPALQEMLDCWWKEVRDKSYRDQISLPYAIWRTGFERYKLIGARSERAKMIANGSHRKVLNV